MGKKVRVTSESKSGRNQRFCDDSKKKYMSRSEFVEQIKKGNYEDYHIREVNGVKTPVSNPDRSESNNLG